MNHQQFTHLRQSNFVHERNFVIIVRMTTDYILAMHKHAHDSIDTGVSFDEMVIYLKTAKIDTTSHMKAIVRAYGDIFFSPSDGELSTRRNEYLREASITRHHMAPEAYFRYLGFIEYKQATKNAEESQKASKTAINYAKWAILLSVIVGTAQIAVAVYFS